MICEKCQVNLRLFETRNVGNNRIRAYICPNCKQIYVSWERAIARDTKHKNIDFRVLVRDADQKRFKRNAYIYRLVRFWLDNNIKVYTSNKDLSNYDLSILIGYKPEEKIKYKNRIYLDYTDDILYNIKEAITNYYKKFMEKFTADTLAD